MATVNRLKKGTKAIQNKDQAENIENVRGQKKEKNSNMKGFESNHQKQFENYAQIAQNNPKGIIPTVKLFPYNLQMSLSFNIPLAFFVSPMISLENQDTQYIDMPIDSIPKCSSCLAYMNCYNTIQKKKFRCFMCNRYSHLEKNYQAGEQTNSSIYQAIGSSNQLLFQVTD